MIAYLLVLLGQLVMCAIEHDEEQRQLAEWREIHQKLRKELSPATYAQLVAKGFKEVGPNDASWDLGIGHSKSLMFSFTLVASIGYGNIYPATDAGRVFCIVFTLIATPALVVAYLGAARKMIDFTRVVAMLFNKTNILTFHKYDTDGSGQLDSDEFAAALRDLGYPVADNDVRMIMEEVNICDTTLVTIQEFGQALILLEFPTARQEKHRLSAMISFSATLTWLLAGALCFQQIERWSFIESMWFCWETLMTIGLGDLVPQTVLGRWFNLAYSFLGLGFISVLLQSVVDLLSKHSSIIGRLEMRILEAGSASTPSFKNLKLQQKVVRKRVSLLQAERSIVLSGNSPNQTNRSDPISPSEAASMPSQTDDSLEGCEGWPADPPGEGEDESTGVSWVRI